MNENVPSPLFVLRESKRTIFFRNNQLDYEKSFNVSWKIKSNQINSRLSCRNTPVACVVKSGIYFLFFFDAVISPTNSNRELHALNQTFDMLIAHLQALLYSSTHQIRQWTQSCIILRFLSCQKMCVGRLIGRPLYFHRLLHYNGHRTNLLWYIYIYSTYCKSGRSSIFIAAFSCLEMGPTEQRQYFTVAWQAAAKVFTASLQCGKMDPGR